MKEIATLAANFHAILTESGKLLPEMELALVLSEPSYKSHPDGGVMRERTHETIRFSCSPKNARELASRLTEFAEQCEEEFDKAIESAKTKP